MRKFRYWARLSYAFISRFKGLLFVGLVMGLFMFTALRFLLLYATGPKTEWVGVVGRYHTEELPNEILTEIGEGLTKIAPDGEIDPALADSWDISEDGKTWTFELKKGVLWHDGSELTSESVNYSFEDLVIERPDKYQVVLKLDNKFAPLLAAVSKPVFKKGLIGTGEWRVKSIRLARSYVETLTLVNAEGQKRVLKFYPTEERARTGYKLGEIDILRGMINPEPFDTWANTSLIEKVDRGKFVGIFLNNQDAIFLDNKPLRQALYYAIDKDSLGERATSPINPDSWAYNPEAKTYEYDAEHARELIADLPEDFWENNELKLVTTPVLLSVAEKVVEDWKEIGVNAKVLVSSILPNEYQAFLAIYDIPEDPDQYAIWHSTREETNISKYVNPRIDKLLEDGRLELDQEERRGIYLDFQRYLLEDAPAIFLYHPIFYTIIRK